MTIEVMLDLETLSTQPNAAILQIAAASFDEHGQVFDTFNVHVRRSSGHIDINTVLWWMSQPSAREQSEYCQQGVTLQKALECFTIWYGVGEPVALWAHGATFDFPILASAFEREAVRVPYSYRDLMCTRPIYGLVGGVPTVPLPAGYVKHDAMSDVRLQIAQLMEARRRIGVLRDL